MPPAAAALAALAAAATAAVSAAAVAAAAPAGIDELALLQVHRDFQSAQQRAATEASAATREKLNTSATTSDLCCGYDCGIFGGPVPFCEMSWRSFCYCGDDPPPGSSSSTPMGTWCPTACPAFAQAEATTTTTTGTTTTATTTTTGTTTTTTTGTTTNTTTGTTTTTTTVAEHQFWKVANAAFTGWRPMSNIQLYSDSECGGTAYTPAEAICSGETPVQFRNPTTACGKSRWRPQCHPCEAGDAWIALDLGEPKEVGCVKDFGAGLGQGSGGHQSWSGGMTIEFSDSGLQGPWAKWESYAVNPNQYSIKAVAGGGDQ